MALLGIWLLALSTVIAPQSINARAVDELVKQRTAARDAVIKLSDSDFKKFIVGKNRPYTAIIFFQANQVVESNPTLQLVELRKEYGLAAKAFANGPSADKIFFFEALLEDTEVPFGTFQVNSLPLVLRISPSLSITRPPVDVPRGDKMVPDAIQAKYPWSAEVFVSHLTTKDITAAPVERPSVLKHPLFPVALLVGLFTFGLTAYFLYLSGFFSKPILWMVGSIVVFWWSVGGGMYNYMRGMPLFIRNKEGRMQFFLQGRNGSLGAEGMIMAGTYCAFSASLALMTYVLPHVKSTKFRYPLSLIFTATAMYSIYQTFTLWMAKTGYSIVQYLF